jgi:hypothetical protein
MRSTHAGARTRRIGAPWLVAAIAALLAACGSGTPDKSDNGSSNGGRRRAVEASGAVQHPHRARLSGESLNRPRVDLQPERHHGGVTDSAAPINPRDVLGLTRLGRDHDARVVELLPDHLTHDGRRDPRPDAQRNTSTWVHRRPLQVTPGAFSPPFQCNIYLSTWARASVASASRREASSIMVPSRATAPAPTRRASSWARSSRRALSTS